MFTSKIPIITYIIKWVTIIFTIVFPLIGFTLQVLFKTLTWLTWLRILFIWNSIYWLIVSFPELTSIAQLYFSYNFNGRLILLAICTFMFSVSLLLLRINTKLNLKK